MHLDAVGANILPSPALGEMGLGHGDSPSPVQRDVGSTSKASRIPILTSAQSPDPFLTIQAKTYLSAVARPLLVSHKSGGETTCRYTPREETT